MDGEPTTAQVFDHLRDCLVDVIGSAATATFLRRALRKASDVHPELRMFAIHKDHLDYQYVVPSEWAAGRAGLPALVILSRELERLLRELTGHVMVRRLQAVPMLTDAGLFQREAGDA